MLQTDLYPVQLLYMSRPKKSKIYDIFAIILKELTLKKVIYYHAIKSFPNQRSRKVQKYGMIMQGSNFYEYFQNTPPFFEKVFLSPLEEIPRAQLRILTDYVTKRYNMPSQFTQHEILGSLSKEGYMSSPPFLRSFGVVSVSSKGKELIQQLESVIEEIKGKYETALNGSDEQFISLIEEAGIYTFFLEHTHHELYEKIKEKTEELFEKILPSVNDYLYIFHSATIIEISGHEEH